MTYKYYEVPSIASVIDICEVDSIIFCNSRIFIENDGIITVKHGVIFKTRLTLKYPERYKIFNKPIYLDHHRLNSIPESYSFVDTEGISIEDTTKVVLSVKEKYNVWSCCRGNETFSSFQKANEHFKSLKERAQLSFLHKDTNVLLDEFWPDGAFAKIHWITPDTHVVNYFNDPICTDRAGAKKVHYLSEVRVVGHRNIEIEPIS